MIEQLKKMKDEMTNSKSIDEVNEIIYRAGVLVGMTTGTPEYKENLKEALEILNLSKQQLKILTENDLSKH